MPLHLKDEAIPKCHPMNVFAKNLNAFSLFRKYPAG